MAHVFDDQWAEYRATVCIYRGLHMRPSVYLATVCRAYPHEIYLFRTTHTANAKKSIEILSLGAEMGDEIHIRVSKSIPGYEKVASDIATIITDPEQILRVELDEQKPMGDRPSLRLPI